MQVITRTIASLIACGIYSLSALADVNLVQQMEIKYLKSYVTQSPCVFLRNGVSYKGSEAITHITRKEEYFKDKIMSTEDFIRLAATKSEISGKNYTVTCTKNHTENLGEWLLKALTAYRNKKP